MQKGQKKGRFLKNPFACEFLCPTIFVHIKQTSEHTNLFNSHYKIQIMTAHSHICKHSAAACTQNNHQFLAHLQKKDTQMRSCTMITDPTGRCFSTQRISTFPHRNVVMWGGHLCPVQRNKSQLVKTKCSVNLVLFTFPSHSSHLLIIPMNNPWTNIGLTAPAEKPQ